MRRIDERACNLKNESAALQSEGAGATSESGAALTSDGIAGLTSESIAELKSESMAGLTSDGIAGLTSRSRVPSTPVGSAASTSESSIAPTQGGILQYIGLARDIGISTAIYVYFLGLVYLYFYFDKFGLGVLDSETDVHLVCVFAWEVIQREPFLTILLAAVGVVLGCCCNYVIGTLADPESAATRIEAAMQKIGTPMADARLLRRTLRALRSLLPVASVLVLIMIFPVLFLWSSNVATRDANDQFADAHHGIRKSFELIKKPPDHEAEPSEPHAPSMSDLNKIAKADSDASKRIAVQCALGENAYDRVEPSTFAQLLEKINDASSCGRVVQVAETASSIVFLVSTPDPDIDNASKRDPKDRVYIIAKSLIAAEELWSR